VVYYNVNKQSLSNGRWQETWGGQFFLIPFQTFFGWLILNKTYNKSKTINKFYCIAHTINKPIIPW